MYKAVLNIVQFLGEQRPREKEAQPVPAYHGMFVTVMSMWILKLIHFRKTRGKGLSVMSGLASNPANREIASSSGACEHQDFCFLRFFFNFF